MHFVVCWNIQATGEKRKAIFEALKRCLKGYSWARPLPGFYIIRIRSSVDWEVIVAKLKVEAKRYTRQVNFVATPLMQGSGYRGWLPKKTWEKIAMRTKEYG
jgi:hypothetical protein